MTIRSLSPAPQLIARSQEAEYFSFYEISERGTSWLGTLAFAFAFAIAYEISASYRWAIVTLIIFFVIGGLLLRTVRVGEGIDAAGNQRPAVL